MPTLNDLATIATLGAVIVSALWFEFSKSRDISDLKTDMQTVQARQAETHDIILKLASRNGINVTPTTQSWK